MLSIRIVSSDLSSFSLKYQVTFGGGSPMIFTSKVTVRPTFTVIGCKLVRSMNGFTVTGQNEILVIARLTYRLAIPIP